MSAIYSGCLLDGSTVAVTVSSNRIQAVEPISPQTDLPLIAPPLVDLQHNGSLGIDFSRLPDDPEAGIHQIAEAVRRHGVGRLYATLITGDLDQARKSLRALNACLSKNPDLDRLIAGIFYEGNFMSSAEGWRGCHDVRYICNPDWDTWQRLQDAAGGRIRVFNVDPSRPGAIETIRSAVSAGLRVSMGHCGPDPETILAAADAGADLVTHFGNGMPPMIHRHRNPLWTWLSDTRFKLSLIADGHHLPSDLLLTVFRAKGRDGAYLVSDASPNAGLPPGIYGEVEIEANGFCHVKGQEILAGAWHQLDRGVERLCEIGWSLPDAWAQASVIPAKLFGVEIPEIKTGQSAEFVCVRYDAGSGLDILSHVSPS